MRIESSNLLRLTEAQIRPASTMLSRAFQDDPLFAAYFPDASERERQLPYFMEFIVRDLDASVAEAKVTIVASTPQLAAQVRADLRLPEQTVVDASVCLGGGWPL